MGSATSGALPISAARKTWDGVRGERCHGFHHHPVRLHGNRRGRPGADPTGSLLLSGTGLYGVTWNGGVTPGGLPAGAGEIFVINLPYAPVAVNETAVETGSGAFTIGIPSGDSDPKGSPFTITNVSEPTLGTVTWTGTTITYTPNLNFVGFAGTDTFTYTITDGHGSSATGEITVGNPYYLQKGNFAGTLTNSGGGYVTLTTTGKGTFSGKLRQALASYSLTGSFNSSGTWSGTVGGNLLSLHFDIGNVTGSVFGKYAVSGSYGGDAFALYHALYNSTSDPAPQVGSYTMLIEPPAQVALVQATASVTTNGKISSIVIGNSGSGYNTTPTVTISAPSGKGATAVATVVNGSITAIKFTSAGSGYPSTGVKVAISAPSGNPLGFGYATLSVTESGAVNISGKLADGTAFTDGVYITGGDSPLANNFPVYVPLAYKQAGSLVGQLTFEDVTGVSDCDGILAWSKPAQTAAGIFQQGFNLTASAIGSRYSAPSKGSLSLALAAGTPNAMLTLSEQGWSAPNREDACGKPRGEIH